MAEPNTPVWVPETNRWGLCDLAALGVWSAAVAIVFWDALTFRGALFFFDITEINLPYRDFLANELKAGRFSRWCPGLYCGLPLYSESQAGYLHPFKYLFYLWMPTWKAFNLDTVFSIWLAGAGAYGWLRRHVGAIGAVTGAAIVGFGGYTWAHLVHTSMLNALASVPLVIWSLESAFDHGRLRPAALGALAIACQVFAGHLQDAIMTGQAVILYGLYRGAIAKRSRERWFAMGVAIGMVALGGLLSAVQWIPSKELLDRSPRAGGLAWDDLTFGSWNPELLPALVVREAYGTLARDTDWMDGFYPYHEMDAYLGLIAIGLAVVGVAAYRDRWVGFWVLLAAIGGILMLGRYSVAMDFWHRVPILGSSRIPVRYHLWVTLAVAALAAVGADRLSRVGEVRLRWAFSACVALILTSVPILIVIYSSIWTHPERWGASTHQEHFAWLGSEISWATARTAILCAVAAAVARAASRCSKPRSRTLLASALPCLILIDLASAHWNSSPTAPPAFWTDPPPSARLIKADPTFLRMYGEGTFPSGIPGYASKPTDFLVNRELLAWSTPLVWGLPSNGGETPIIPRRRLWFTDWHSPARLDLDGLTHLVVGRARPNLGPLEQAGSVYVFRNRTALPRVRLLGRPFYAESDLDAGRKLRVLGSDARSRILVEDPDRPLNADAEVAGSARIVREIPERVEIETDSTSASYLLIADTFDPGWTATVDGNPAPVRPAYIAFRAVFLKAGKHNVVFTYEPVGFKLGLGVSALGVFIFLTCFAWPRALATLEPRDARSPLPRGWPWGLVFVAALLIAASIPKISSDGIGLQRRWKGVPHYFTWGAGIEAMRPPPPRLLD